MEEMIKNQLRPKKTKDFTWVKDVLEIGWEYYRKKTTSPPQPTPPETSPPTPSPETLLSSPSPSQSLPTWPIINMFKSIKGKEEKPKIPPHFPATWEMMGYFPQKPRVSSQPFRIREHSAHGWLRTAYSAAPYVGRVMATSTGGGPKAGYATSSISTNEPVVSVDWLHSNLKEADIKVLDASWYMPHDQRNPIQEYQVAHIPGALFFDLDRISDRTTNLPHMLPSEEAFAAACSALGIENKDRVVVYDGKGLFSAARVWWMFRIFGHEKVWVLDGGLPRWRASGYEVESSASDDAILKANAACEVVEKLYQGQPISPITFKTKFHPHLVWTLDQGLHRLGKNRCANLRWILD